MSKIESKTGAGPWWRIRQISVFKKMKHLIWHAYICCDVLKRKASESALKKSFELGLILGTNLLQLLPEPTRNTSI